ncbi:epoxide hydrolase 1-like [Oppia nitens]|uniref:epoxide hydrolase 1-like n=1 Tax=Oppia nitens TaxID=1686743 RepID=UPI0023DA1149|nr:epoxide hydrolase 1-like [Oppia nitens]
MYIALIRYIIGAYIPSLFLTTDEYSLMYPFWEKFTFLLRESGYMHIQSTKPDSVGTALTDSPVGLCAYILEKFSTWTNPDNTTKQNGGLEEKFKLDDLLTNISVYWLTGNITSSLRYYKESFGNTPSGKILVPTAVADFPHELARMPEKWLRETMLPQLTQYTRMPSGGHFGAFELPKQLSDDIKSFVRLIINRE